MSKLLSILNENVEYNEKQISSFTKIKEIAEEEAKKFGDFHPFFNVIFEAEDGIRLNKKMIELANKQIDFLNKAKKRQPIEVMYFQFSPFLKNKDHFFNKMIQGISSFNGHHERKQILHLDHKCKEINLEDTYLFVSEKISDIEANIIWEYIVNFRYQNNETIFDEGQLLFWNGLDLNLSSSIENVQ